MKRRKFLQSAALGSALALSKPSAVFSSKNAIEPEYSPREFDLAEITISELQAGMKSGKFTAHSLVRKYLERIDDVDSGGPKINSVIELNPEAAAIAEALDRERKLGKLRGPLHGIPILIKDNIDTADRLTTTAGSLALEGSHATRDSFVAKKLRDAGAIILGKTNLSEWANFRSSHSTSGLERSRRPDKKPLRAGSKSVWLKFRIGSWSGGQSLRCRHWN